MPAERRGLLFGSASDHMEGRGVLIMASISLQDLKRRLYRKAKADRDWGFWGLYVMWPNRRRCAPRTTLRSATTGAPGIDGVTFEAIAVARSQ